MNLRWIPTSVGIAVCCVLVSSCASTPSPQKASGESLSLSPAGDQAYHCLRDKGWDVSLSWDGGVSISSSDIPTAQRELYEADSDSCWGEIDSAVASMSTEQIKETYQRELEARDCLIRRGYDVEAPPSEQAYVDHFFDDRWMAYSSAGIGQSAMDDDDWRALNEACPQPAWSLGVAP